MVHCGYSHNFFTLFKRFKNKLKDNIDIWSAVIGCDQRRTADGREIATDERCASVSFFELKYNITGSFFNNNSNILVGS